MLSKLTDTANILKAKITKDELQEKLVQATSEQNWQTPTNILHDIANAAYNYEKWQKINDFIWDKLKKKPTWRKIMKTLNLVEFLIKNGPPNSISSFKYDIYQFRSFSDYELREDGIDRGEAIREKSKQIVELLSNEQHLEQEREKAKKIRQKMSNITGGSSYGGYNGNSYGASSSDGRYESFNSKSYTDKTSTNSSYGNSNYGGLGVYGDYTSGKSTLDKYKTDNNKKPDNTPSINKPLIVPNITGVDQQQNTNTKKPFSQLAKKLEKPASKNQAVKPQPPSPNKNRPAPATGTSSNTNNGDLFDLMGDSTPPQASTPSAPIMDINTGVNIHQNNGNSAHTSTGNQNIGQIDFTQATQAPQVQQPNLMQAGLNFNQGFNQPVFNQQSFNQGFNPQVYNQQGFNQQGFNQLGFNQGFAQQQTMGINQPYGQSYGQTFGQSYGGQPQMFGQHQGYNPQQTQGYQANQQINTNPYQNFQPTPSVSLSAPTPTVSHQTQITLSSKPVTLDSGNTSSSSNLKWLSSNQKGLIDFSDFSNEIKNQNTVNAKNNIMKAESTGNNITIDMWKW